MAGGVGSDSASARARISSLGSMPTTWRPRRANSRDEMPVPAPTSTTSDAGPRHARADDEVDGLLGIDGTVGGIVPGEPREATDRIGLVQLFDHRSPFRCPAGLSCAGLCCYNG